MGALSQRVLPVPDMEAPSMPWMLRACLFFLLATMACACSRESPEAKLRQALASIGESLESHDASTLEEWLAEDFIGPGGMDRAGARRTAAVMFIRHRDIGVNIGPARVELDEGHATARFEALLTGGSGRLLPDSAQVYEVESGWRLEDGEWRLTSVTWSEKL